jgi:CBS domain-containing protein
VSQQVNTVMVPNPVLVPTDSPVMRVAEKMARHHIGDVLVMDGDQLYGVVTDRDIVVRGIAAGRDIYTTPARDIASRQMITLQPEDSVDKAVSLMREHHVRRLPVCQDGQPIGMLSLGDLAMERDPKSALADISAAPANK